MHRCEILIETIGNIVLHSESQILIFVQLYNGVSVYVHTCNYRSVRIQFQQYFSPFLHNPISNSLEELKNIGRGFITYHHICSSKFFFFFLHVLSLYDQNGQVLEKESLPWELWSLQLWQALNCSS